jgi:hypothetical protein
VFDYGNPPALGPDQDEYAARSRRPLPRASPPWESLSGAILKRTCSAPSWRPWVFAKLRILTRR